MIALAMVPRSCLRSIFLLSTRMAAPGVRPRRRAQPEDALGSAGHPTLVDTAS
jgi:hypothetical protein